METNNQTVYFGCDMENHALKQMLKDFLKEKGIKFVDLGTFDNDPTQFPIIKRELSEKVAQEPNPVGILIFGKNNNL